jgi:hypothetical protein
MIPAWDRRQTGDLGIKVTEDKAIFTCAQRLSPVLPTSINAGQKFSTIQPLTFQAPIHKEKLDELKVKSGCLYLVTGVP